MGKKKPKSTDVNAPVAAEKIKTIDSVDELEAYVADELAKDEPRVTVTEPYEARKAELEAEADAAEDAAEAEDSAKDEESEEAEEQEPETIAVFRAELKKLADGCAQRLEGIKAIKPHGAKLNATDGAFEQATKRLQRLANGKGKKVEVDAEELSHILAALKRKADDDARTRGMQQPSKDQQALIDVLEPAEEQDF